MSKIIFEPFRIKVVEPIKVSTVEERRQWIADAGYNVFNLRSEQVMVDLLTDSGTAAMSQEQWAAMQAADESYAGSRDFFTLEQVAQDIFGKKIIIPVHQGRAAEHLVFSTLVQDGQLIPSNGHFDTTAANIEDNGATAINLPVPEAKELQGTFPFKGNMNLDALEQLLAESVDRIPFVMVTITNNTGGGQPVSVANVEAVRTICDQFKKPLIIDACRFAENAHFVKRRDHSVANLTSKEIAARIFACASIITFSGKKDALSNIGGLVALDDEILAEQLKNRLVITEGFATYGGLSGRDLAAMAQGLREVLDEEYLTYRLRTIEWTAERLSRAGVPVLLPSGGHGVYIDAGRFFSKIPPEEFPGISLVTELYIRGGIRSAELGNVAFGHKNEDGKMVFPEFDFVRFAFPRRVYTEAHSAYLVETILEVFSERDSISGYRFKKEAPVMRHFRSTFEPV